MKRYRSISITTRIPPVLTKRETRLFIRLRKLEGTANEPRTYRPLPFTHYLRIVCKPKVYKVDGQANRAMRHVYLKQGRKIYMKGNR